YARTIFSKIGSNRSVSFVSTTLYVCLNISAMTMLSSDDIINKRSIAITIKGCLKINFFIFRTITLIYKLFIWPTNLLRRQSLISLLRDTGTGSSSRIPRNAPAKNAPSEYQNESVYFQGGVSA